MGNLQNRVVSLEQSAGIQVEYATLAFSDPEQIDAPSIERAARCQTLAIIWDTFWYDDRKLLDDADRLVRVFDLMDKQGLPTEVFREELRRRLEPNKQGRVPFSKRKSLASNLPLVVVIPSGSTFHLGDYA